MGKLTKLLILPFLFLLISTASASPTWELEGTTELKLCSLSCGSPSVSIADFNNDNVLINIIESGNITETLLLSMGESELFNNDMSKVTYYMTNGAKKRIAVYTRNVPEFSISTETRHSGNYYNSEITIKCLDQQAENVKISLDSENVDFTKNFKESRFNRVNEDVEIVKKIKYKMEGCPEIIVKIEYEDSDNNDYLQEFDVLKNVKIVNEPKPEKVSKGYTIIQRDPEEREKGIFYRAIERALNRIEFSGDSEEELLAIMEQLE